MRCDGCPRWPAHSLIESTDTAVTIAAMAVLGTTRGDRPHLEELPAAAADDDDDDGDDDAVALRLQT